MTNETIKIKVQEESGVNWQIEERQTNLNNGQWLWALAIIGFAVVIFMVSFVISQLNYYLRVKKQKTGNT